MGQQNTGGTKPETIEDLRDSLTYTPEEMKKWYHSCLIDVQNGTMNKEEFKKAYFNLYTHDGDCSALAEHVFRVFDRNGDGNIDFKEFIAHMTTISKGKIDDKLSAAFNVYDINANGFISREEMLEIIESIYKLVEHITEFSEDEATPEMRVTKFMELMDKNQDGQLSLKEFIKGAKKCPTVVKILRYDKW